MSANVVKIVLPHYHCNFDGAISKNPGGVMGWGAVIHKDNKKVLAAADGREASEFNSNNVAEFLGLEIVLDYLLLESTEKGTVTIEGDSLMVIKQMIGHYRIGEGLYTDMATKCLNKLEKVREKFAYKKILFNPYMHWVKRDENVEADILSKEGLKIGAAKQVKKV